MRRRPPRSTRTDTRVPYTTRCRSRLDRVDDARAPWWMMTSGDEMAIKALEAVLGRKGWEDDAGKLMVGVAQRQRRGHWDTTPANAWGATVVRRFAELYPASAITGTTRIALAGGSAAQDRKSTRLNSSH